MSRDNSRAYLIGLKVRFHDRINADAIYLIILPL